MTTLPSIPTRPHVQPESVRLASEDVPGVRIAWRVLRRVTDPSGLRGGQVRTSQVEASLTESTIVLRQIEGSQEISALVLPARGRLLDTPAGSLLEWRVLQDGTGESPSLRLLSADGAPPLVRCDLLDRLGVGGGRHEITSIEMIPTSPQD
jgi:hypothetical protein